MPPIATCGNDQLVIGSDLPGTMPRAARSARTAERDNPRHSRVTMYCIRPMDWRCRFQKMTPGNYRTVTATGQASTHNSVHFGGGDVDRPAQPPSSSRINRAVYPGPHLMGSAPESARGRPLGARQRTQDQRAAYPSGRYRGGYRDTAGAKHYVSDNGKGMSTRPTPAPPPRRPRSEPAGAPPSSKGPSRPGSPGATGGTCSAKSAPSTTPTHVPPQPAERITGSGAPGARAPSTVRRSCPPR